jgi:hypothetical protein
VVNYYSYLFMYNGYYQTGPFLSPENTFRGPSTMDRAGCGEGIDIGPAMDNQLLSQLFTDVIEAATVLGINGTHRTNA